MSLASSILRLARASGMIDRATALVEAALCERAAKAARRRLAKRLYTDLGEGIMRIGDFRLHPIKPAVTYSCEHIPEWKRLRAEMDRIELRAIENLKEGVTPGQPAYKAKAVYSQPTVAVRKAKRSVAARGGSEEQGNREEGQH